MVVQDRLVAPGAVRGPAGLAERTRDMVGVFVIETVDVFREAGAGTEQRLVKPDWLSMLHV